MKEYSRKITEVFPIGKWLKHLRSLTKHYVRYALTVLVLLLILLVWQLYELINIYNQVRNERIHAINRLTYWNKVIENHSNFPDAYYQAAVYSYSLGDTKRAGELLDKALFLDPQFKDAMELRKRL